MSNFTLSSEMLTGLWLLGAVLLVAYIMRRRKRKML